MRVGVGQASDAVFDLGLLRLSRSLPPLQMLDALTRAEQTGKEGKRTGTKEVIGDTSALK